LYYVQEDTTSNVGFTFLVLPHKYPRLTQAPELAQPLVYITTRDERTKLQTSAAPKLNLDQFWQDVGGNREHARALIRDYYGHVEGANQHFTTFKEGWKTDQGIILTVFGAPDKVLRDDNRETWYYDKTSTAPATSFVFVRRPTIFTLDNYELVRYPEYDQIWYATVEQWRKGILKQ
jgi:GWxTD domain-containing protein